LIHGCFTHVRGIGPKTAALLEESGFSSWDDCLNRIDELPFNGTRRKRFISELEQSVQAFHGEDIGYFISSFSTSEQWRILARYFKSAAFIDVETTGLSWHYCHASVIAAFHNGAIHSFRYGENLDEFLDLVENAELLVTFNGNCFDIPFLEKTFNIPAINCPHIDLRWIAWHRGRRGGLKQIERAMGIRRPACVEGVDGFEAVDLFYRWQQGDLEARQTLIRYCAADVLSTYLLAERLLAEHGCSIESSDQAGLFEMINSL
jgi:uncharacterized protein YprB with RNaseH-like and TPR domain